MMEQSLARTIWIIYLQAQGLSGLLLILVCGTLYAHRRRAYFLYWTLAWFAFSLWRLFSGLSLGEHWLAPSLANGPIALAYIAAVCGWWHVSLWLFGLLHLRQVYQVGLTRAGASARPAVPPLRVTLYCLIGTAGLAILLRAILPAASPRILSAVMAVVYGSSSVWFAWRWWRTGQLGVLMLPVSLGLCALARLYSATLAPDAASAPVPLTALYYTALLDFLLQTFTVVAMIVVLLGDEEALLREAGERLAESEDRFRLVFDHGGVGMALLSPEGDFLQVNPALIQMLGYPQEQLIGVHVTDLMHNEDRGSGHHLRARADKPQYEHEKRFLTRDGRIVWARMMRVPIRDAQGALRYHATVFVDVTERKHAEQALAASEMGMRLRFQQAFDGISLWSPNGTFLDANPALCRLVGRSREELLGRNVAELAAEPEAMQRHLRAVLESSSDRSETRLFSRDGSLVDVEVNSAVMEVEDQRIILGICRDISDRKRAEAALRQAQVALRDERDFITQILQTADALIMILDPAGRILRFNDKCQHVSGYTEEEVRGRSFWECVLPERIQDKARRRFQETVTRADPNISQVFENVWRTRDGSERVIAWRCSLLRDEQGPVRCAIGIGLDITEQRRLEEQVARTRKMETLGTLVGGVAHDFNNQLTAILGNLDLVRSDLQTAVGQPSSSRFEDMLPCVLDAERAAQRCARMTARLLTFSRGRIGTLKPVALEPLLRETTRTLQHELPSLTIEVEAPAGIWPVNADVTQIQELLLNLATNAAEAMPDGGTLTLSLANRPLTADDCQENLEARPGAFVELGVRDTGRGMTPEVRERIFDPFFTTKRIGQGAGLGLSVAFGIVKGHKGWITVQSQPGEGAAFRIYLPVAGSRAPTPRPPHKPAPTPPPDGTILVVDDEAVVRDLARTVLERMGFRVLTAEGGEEALDIYRRQGSEIDLILLDYIMPRMNGVQTLKELQQLDRGVCVIFSSGYSTEHEADQLLAAGARAFIAKPYRPQELVQTIRQVLTAKRTVLSSE
jgi:PAS domain S-box-containing protein